MIGFRIDKVSPEFDEQFVAEACSVLYHRNSIRHR